MKRGLVFALAFAVVATAPTAASAAKWRGVVVAKDPGRKVVVTASRGTMRTLRAPGRFQALRIGNRIVARGVRLADGTFRSQGVRRVGRSRAARLHVTVVKQQGNMGRTIVSGGGTVFALRGGRHYEVGDELDCLVRINPVGRLHALACDEIGHASSLELEGIFLDASDGLLRLAVLHRGLVTVTVPDDVELPDYEAGDLIEILVSVEEDGSLTLVSSQGDEGERHDGDGVDFHDGMLIVEGTYVGSVDGSVSVQPGDDAAPVSCLVPESADLSGFSAGDEVRLRCLLVDGAYQLDRLKSTRRSGRPATTTPPSLATMIRPSLVTMIRPSPVTTIRARSPATAWTRSLPSRTDRLKPAAPNGPPSGRPASLSGFVGVVAAVVADERAEQAGECDAGADLEREACGLGALDSRREAADCDPDRGGDPREQEQDHAPVVPRPAAPVPECVVNGRAAGDDRGGQDPGQHLAREHRNADGAGEGRGSQVLRHQTIDATNLARSATVRLVYGLHALRHHHGRHAGRRSTLRT